MEPTPHVLVVEDDQEISALVARFLRSNAVRVSTASDGRDIDRMLRDGRIDLIVLDLMLPGEDGLSLCRRLRSTSSWLPIIMLTAKAEEVDRIVGLELGARIRAVLRRGGSAATAADRSGALLHFAGWQLDQNTRVLLNPDQVRVPLTGAEFELLVALCERPRRVLSRDQLLDLTQGRAAAPFERSIDVLISRLRQKMEVDPRDPMLIKTIRSGGYLFTPEVNSA
jgi:two-component system OmpR family response regulator